MTKKKENISHGIDLKIKSKNLKKKIRVLKIHPLKIFEVVRNWKSDEFLKTQKLTFYGDISDEEYLTKLKK